MNQDQLSLLMAIRNFPRITTSELISKFSENKYLKITLSRLRKQGFIKLTTQRKINSSQNRNFYLYYNSITPKGEDLIEQYMQILNISPAPNTNIHPNNNPKIKYPSKGITRIDIKYQDACDSQVSKMELVMEWAEYLVMKRYSNLSRCPPQMQEFFDAVAKQIVDHCIEQLEEE